VRAVGYARSLPVTDPDCLLDLDLPEPEPAGHDLLVEVRAVSVNPVDTKIRLRAAPPEGGHRILGWDAAGIVRATGPDATRFRPGSAVFYAGDLTRPGTNAALHRVDERIVGAMPASLTFAEAAALPLTAITAWEALFDRLRVRTHAVPGAAPALLVVGGAGGVGSIAIQLARQLTDLTVIATASRPETRDWALSLGAHHVVDHARPLSSEVAALGLGAPGLALCTTHSSAHLPELARLIAPQGRLAVIEDTGGLDVSLLKEKSISLHWEYMFTRSMFGTADMAEQGALLDEVARLVDAGTLRTTLGETLGPINAANLRRAHALIESGRARGKVVLDGF